MNQNYPLSLLAVFLSLGCLVAGQLVVKNDLDSVLARYDHISTYYNLLKAGLYGSYKGQVLGSLTCGSV